MKMKKLVIVNVLVMNLPSLQCLKPGPNRCINEDASGLLKFFCCHGYKEVNGKCVDCPECYHTQMCPTGFCSKGCTTECSTCLTFEVCDPIYCCVCPSGFKGNNCSTPCEDGFYGPNCMKECMCNASESCNSQTGNCTNGNVNDKNATTSSINISSLEVPNSSGMSPGYLIFIVSSVVLTVGFLSLTFIIRYKRNTSCGEDNRKPKNTG